MRSKSSIESLTPKSFAVAGRCSTAFVDPPVAITPAMAFSKLLRVTIERGVMPFLTSPITILPHSKAISSLRGSTAGTSFHPIGEIPSIS